MEDGMMTGKVEGANANGLPTCRAVKDAEGKMTMECKQPGSDEWVFTPEDKLGIFQPSVAF
jgi:hypothetical protein